MFLYQITIDEYIFSSEVHLKKLFELILQFFRKLDKPLFFASLTLGACSVIMLYSIVTNDAATIQVTSRLYRMQAAALGAGAAAAIIVSALDYHKIVKLWFLYVPVCIALVLLTFTEMGVEVESTGDRAWLDLGFGTLQPSELLKIAFICTF